MSYPLKLSSQVQSVEFCDMLFEVAMKSFMTQGKTALSHSSSSYTGRAMSSSKTGEIGYSSFFLIKISHFLRDVILNTLIKSCFS